MTHLLSTTLLWVFFVSPKVCPETQVVSQNPFIKVSSLMRDCYPCQRG